MTKNVGKRGPSSKVGKTVLKNFFALHVFFIFFFLITQYCFCNWLWVFINVVFVVLSICKYNKRKVYLWHLLHITGHVFFIRRILFDWELSLKKLQIIFMFPGLPLYYYYYSFFVFDFFINYYVFWFV